MSRARRGAGPRGRTGRFASVGLWTLCVACVAACAAQITLGRQNLTLRAEVQQRQQFVQQTVPLQTLYQEMARALAELGERGRDEQLRALLREHGISVTNAPPAAGATK